MNDESRAIAAEIVRLAEDMHSSQESAGLGYETITNHERHCFEFVRYCKNNGLALARAHRAALERLEKFRACDTCGGDGVMSVIVDVLPPDEREVEEDVVCGECGGSGIGYIGRLEQQLAREQAALSDICSILERFIKSTGVEWPDVKKAIELAKQAREGKSNE